MHCSLLWEVNSNGKNTIYACAARRYVSGAQKNHVGNGFNAQEF